MRSIFLIFALSALLSAQAFQLNLDFLNDQSWATLGTPFIWTGFGSHSECFERLDYNETGRFTATSDYKENLDGVLSIPIYKDSNTNPLNLNIYWNFNDLENPEVIVFLDSTKGEASLNSTAFTIASANYSPISWSTISLGWGFYAATYLSDGIYLNDGDSQNVNIRLFWDPKLTNGNYTIYTWKNKYAVSNWDANTKTRNMVVQLFQTNPTDGWQKYTITNIFDDVYTIQPLDYQSINTTNYIAAAPVNSNSGSFIEQPFDKTGRQFLWRIATNDWGLWTISLHGANLFWGLGNDNAALGDRILLQTEFNGDFTQKFYFAAA